jgi:uncharacterized repeat protein (TIGR01451 family)
MHGPRLLAGLALLSLCVLVLPAPAQQVSADAVPPAPPPSAKDPPAAAPAEITPVSGTLPMGPPCIPCPPNVVPCCPTIPAGQGPVKCYNPCQSPVTTIPKTATTLANRQEPAVSLEWIGPSAARLGQPAAFRILVRNVSSTPVQQVVVRCPVPDTTTVSVSDPLPLTRGNILTWELGTLAAGQERRIDLQLMPAARATLDLHATVTFSGTAGLRVLVREPKLVLKMMAPQRVVLGDSATVTLTISNPGDGPCEHVKILAALPEGLEHPRGRQIEVDLGALAPQEQRTLQLVCAARGQGAQRCEAAAVADGGLKTAAVGTVDVVLPRIDLTVSGPHLRYLERKAVYTFKATNPGSASAGNVTLQAILPAGLKFRSASAGGQYDATTGSVAWCLGELPAGQGKDVTLELIPISTGDQVVRAQATATRGLKTESNVTTHVEGLSSLLLEVADADDPVEVGTDTSYEIRVTNTGSKMETNLQLTCTLPDHMELKNARCAAGCRFHADGHEVIFEPLPRLAPKADVVYRVFVRGTGPGDLRFRAVLQAEGRSEPLIREETTKVYSDDEGAH